MHLTIYATSTDPASAHLVRLAKLAQISASPHRLTDDPHAADIILFIDRVTTETIVSHPLYREHPERCVVYSSQDRPYALTSLPGLYPSLPRSCSNPYLHRGAPYLHVKNEIEPDLAVDPVYLYSFVGSVRGLAVRNSLMKLPLSRAYLQDTSDYKMFKSQKEATITDPAKIEEQRRLYADVMLQSKFILCPRGVGTSSFRLYETMRAGRVPVILSDEWVAPPGIDWNLFSIRVPERSADRIPDILAACEPMWEAMARRARRAWEEHFAPNTIFHHIAESCLSIVHSKHLAHLHKPRRRMIDVVRSLTQ